MPSLDAAAEAATRAAVDALVSATSPAQVTRVLAALAAAVGLGSGGGGGGGEGGGRQRGDADGAAPSATTSTASRRPGDAATDAAVTAAEEAASALVRAARQETEASAALANADAAADAAASSTTTAVVAALHRGGRYAALADVLLSVVAPDWLPSLAPPEASTLDAWFLERRLAPAPAAAEALVSHLAAVTAEEEAAGGGPPPPPSSLSVSALAPGAAARLLAARFVEGDGLAELVGLAATESGGTVGGWAATLAAAPDRAAAALPAGGGGGGDGVSAPALAAGLARRAALLARDGAASPPDGAGATLLGGAVGRLAVRGWAAAVAAGLWAAATTDRGGGRPPSRPPLAPILAAVGSAGGATALELVATALLLRAAAGEAGGRGEGAAAQAAAAALATAVGPAAWAGWPGLAFLTQDKLLTRGVLPPDAAAALVALLARVSGDQGGHPSATPPLAAATAALARAWAAPGAAAALPPARGAYMAWVLCACLDAAPPASPAMPPALLSDLLRGIGDRLDSPLPPARRQGMRVGDALARALGPIPPAADGSTEGFDPAAGGGLFAGCCGDGEGGGDGHAVLLPEEWWDRGCAALAPPPPPPSATAPPSARPPPALAPHEAGAVAWAPALRDEGGEEIPTAASLVGPTAAGGAGPPVPATVAGVAGDRSRPAQLRDVTAALRRGSAGGPGEDDPAGVVAAVGAALTLVRAAPPELAGPAAAALARALLHARLPAWADEEAAAAAAGVGPAEGAALAPAGGVCSLQKTRPLLPSQQRLDALVAAIAADPLAAGGAVATSLYSPHLDMAQRLLVLDALCGGARALAGGGGGEGGGALPPGSDRAAGGALPPPPPPRRNRFAAVAVPWATALLAECDVERHGVDLFGRDAAVLGRLLTTLATFADAAGPCLPGAQVAAATLELVRAPAVHAAPSPFVRRCALAATAAAAGAVPPAVIAGAALRAAEAAAAGGGGGGAGPGGDAALLDRLAWARAWVEGVAAGGGGGEAEPDPQCRLLAAAAAAGFERLAGRALEGGGGGGGGGGVAGGGLLPSGGSAALGNRLGRVVLPGAAARVRLE